MTRDTPHDPTSSRRDVLRGLGATVVAGVAGCTRTSSDTPTTPQLAVELQQAAGDGPREQTPTATPPSGVPIYQPQWAAVSVAGLLLAVEAASAASTVTGVTPDGTATQLVDDEQPTALALLVEIDDEGSDRGTDAAPVAERLPPADHWRVVDEHGQSYAPLQPSVADPLERYVLTYADQGDTGPAYGPPLGREPDPQYLVFQPEGAPELVKLTDEDGRPLAAWQLERTNATE